MPLSFADMEQENVISRIGGNDSTKKFLESLGFVPGESVKIINKLGGNVIVEIKNSRVAVSEEMARRIMV
ncbi:MAG: ferrous iron transport protein A [Clostridiales bacterium]|nr:ferrous iron transport protein A [Clostridiales bacterium]